MCVIALGRQNVGEKNGTRNPETKRQTEAIARAIALTPNEAAKRLRVSPVSMGALKPASNVRVKTSQ